MSQDELTRKGQDILQIVSKAKEFTEEVLKENERLRFKIASLEAGGGAQGADERVQALQRRVHELEEKLAEIEARYRKVEEENKEFADRYIEIEEQNNNLANLYVASYQLHSTLDFREVVRIVQEIVINLIGAEAFHVFMVSEKAPVLELEVNLRLPLVELRVGERPERVLREGARESHGVADEGLEGVAVSVESDGGWNDTYTGADGTYTVGGLAPGNYRVHFNPSEYNQTHEPALAGERRRIAANPIAASEPSMKKAKTRERCFITEPECCFCWTGEPRSRFKLPGRMSF